MSANSQVARNQSRQTFGSVYESTNPLTTIAGQRVVEWFTGKSLNTDRWGYGGSSSGTANSVAMPNSIDGGVELSAGGTGYNYVWLTTGISGTDDNDNRPHAALDYMRFDPDGCSIVCVMKFASALSTTDECGFSFSTEGSGYTNRANQVSLRVASSSANYTLRSHTSGGVTTPSSDVAVDTAFHTFKVDLRPTFSQLTIDGVLAVGADSTYKPTVPLEPNFSCASTNNNTATINVTYIEAYNT